MLAFAQTRCGKQYHVHVFMYVSIINSGILSESEMDRLKVLAEPIVSLIATHLLVDSFLDFNHVHYTH